MRESGAEQRSLAETRRDSNLRSPLADRDPLRVETQTMNSEPGTLIFVYGTLKRGFCRSRHLDGQTFLAEAVTLPGYIMYDCGEYPGLVVDAASGVSIRGELWRVDERAIAILDEVEGVSENWFLRQAVELQQPVVSETVHAYYYQGDVTRLPEYGDHWIKGV